MTDLFDIKSNQQHFNSIVGAAAFSSGPVLVLCVALFLFLKITTTKCHINMFLAAREFEIKRDLFFSNLNVRFSIEL